MYCREGMPADREREWVAHGEEAIIEGHMATLSLQRWKYSSLRPRFAYATHVDGIWGRGDH